MNGDTFIYPLIIGPYGIKNTVKSSNDPFFFIFLKGIHPGGIAFELSCVDVEELREQSGALLVHKQRGRNDGR